MKTTFLFLALVLLPFTWVSAQTPVTGYPILDNSNIATVERYLARSVVMGRLTEEGDMANANGYAWNTTMQGPSWNPHFWADSIIGQGATCDPDQICAGYCSSQYCPDSYVKDIAMLANIDAAFIMSAVGTWGFYNRLKSNSPYLARAKQTVDDINDAYDRAGKRRPIIQASNLWRKC